VPTRTTLTLDDDVAARIAAEARRTRRPYRAVVNEALRAGLERNAEAPRARFALRTSDLGLRPGISIDSITALIEELEGPRPR
jgi:hypothetical protein